MSSKEEVKTLTAASHESVKPHVRQQSSARIDEKKKMKKSSSVLFCEPSQSPLIALIMIDILLNNRVGTI